MNYKFTDLIKKNLPLRKIFYFHPVSYINYNGKILPAGENIAGASNRGLRYGDGLFETIKLREGRIILCDEHLARLWKGMTMLKFAIPKLFSPDKIESSIIALANKNRMNDARIRVTVFRGDGGIYDAKDHAPNYIIETLPLNNFEIINQNGLTVCTYRDAQKTTDAFSNLKHNNYLPYFMGALFAKEQKCNDAFILNINGNISDSTIANVFLVKDNIIYTPALSEGCVAGVTRKWIIGKVREMDISVIEQEISEQMLIDADEIFLTNAISNIRWVAEFEGKKYVNKISSSIASYCYKYDPQIFC